MSGNTVSLDHRLRKHADYQRVYKAGRKRFGKAMAYFFALREPVAGAPIEATLTGPRIGLTVPKAIGKAVTRNRIKRRMRAALRPSLPLLQAPVDVVLHPRKSVAECSFAAIEQEIANIFRAVQAGMGQTSTGQANTMQGSKPHSRVKPDPAKRPTQKQARP